MTEITRAAKGRFVNTNVRMGGGVHMCGVVTNQGEDIKWSDEIRGSCVMGVFRLTYPLSPWRLQGHRRGYLSLGTLPGRRQVGC